MTFQAGQLQTTPLAFPGPPFVVAFGSDIIDHHEFGWNLCAEYKTQTQWATFEFGTPCHELVSHVHFRLVFSDLGMIILDRILISNVD